MTIHPSFRPWLWCCAWLALIWSTLWLLTNALWLQVKGGPYPYNLNDSRLEELGSTRIVALGDSLLLVSLPRTGEFDATLADDIYWLHLASGGVDWNEFIPLIPQLGRLKPDVLLVHDQLLLYRGARSTKPFPVRARTMLSFYVSSFLNLKNKPAQRMRAPLNFERAVQLRIWIYSKNPEVHPGGIDFLDKLKMVSDRVIVFTLPRSENMRLRVEPENWLADLDRHLNRLGIERVTLGEPLPDDYYRDGAHVNKKGRQVRMDQFGELVGELNQ